MTKFYTVVANYYTAVEGHTLMLLVTTGHGDDDCRTNSINRFKEIFGEYYSRSAVIYEGLMLDISFIDRLLHPETRKSLESWQDDGPSNLEYFSSLHVNFP